MSTTATVKGTFSASVHQLPVGLFRVRIIPAPPVAKGISGQHGSGTAEMIEIFQRLPVIMSVAKEIQILSPFFPGLHPAVRQQRQGIGVIQKREAIPGDHPVVQIHGSVRLVQGPNGAAQILYRIPIMPDTPVIAHISLYLDAQAMGRKFFLIVDQVKTGSVDLDSVFLSYYPIRHLRKIPVHHHLSRAVFKGLIVSVFQADQPLCQHRDPVPFSRHLAGSGSGRVCMNSVNFFHDDLLCRFLHSLGEIPYVFLKALEKCRGF
jgi:hypothetical protein